MATDGVAQIIIRIPANAVGQQITVSLADGVCEDLINLFNPTCVDEYGVLFDPSVPPPPELLFSEAIGQFPVQVKAVATSEGPMAFLAYRSPLDFVRSGDNAAIDQSAGKRSVQIVINGLVAQKAIELVRPPVAYIHGLTSGPTSWASFTPLINDPRFVSFALSYDEDIDSQVSSTTPSYSVFRLLFHINANVAGITWNAKPLFAQMTNYLTPFKQATPFYNLADGRYERGNLPVASVQFDVIGHSMGGLIARAMWYLPNFSTGQNYKQGSIHKLITIGTPHLGSQNALRLLDGTNDCVRNRAPLSGFVSASPSYALDSLVIGGERVTGAVADLVGDGTLQRSSALIQSLQFAKPGRTDQFPMAMIAGEASQAQLNSIDGSVAQAFTQASCGPNVDIGFDGDFLANNFSGSRWPMVFAGQASDAVVSVPSALNGSVDVSDCTQQGGSTCVIFPAVHGPGTVDELGFGAPHLQEGASGTPNAVLNLLNTSVAEPNRFTMMP